MQLVPNCATHHIFDKVWKKHLLIHSLKFRFKLVLRVFLFFSHFLASLILYNLALRKKKSVNCDGLTSLWLFYPNYTLNFLEKIDFDGVHIPFYISNIPSLVCSWFILSFFGLFQICDPDKVSSSKFKLYATLT